MDPLKNNSTNGNIKNLDNFETIEELDQATRNLLEKIRNQFLEYLEILESENDLFAAINERFIPYNLSKEEMLMLKLGFLFELKPEALRLLVVYDHNQRPFSEIGGYYISMLPDMVPTVQTAKFLLEGKSEVSSGLSMLPYIDERSTLRVKNLMMFNAPENGFKSAMMQTLQVTEEAMSILQGAEFVPVFNSEFPAQRIKTNLEWSDLVLTSKAMAELEDIQNWIEYHDKAPEEWNVDRNVKKGYRAMFYGPSGTGKTLCATLLGKYTGKEVYKINLGMVVSKYVGETEKNLARIFDQAEHRDWILFFDEAESLFGKRTDVKSSNDRFANQETGFLLQRIEDYNGVIILASNLKDNMDQAFTRRFQSTIHFPAPSKSERLSLWKNNLESLPLDRSVNLKEIADLYDITGGNIINVLRYCAIQASMREEALVYQQDIIYGLKREYEKEGRMMRP